MCGDNQKEADPFEYSHDRGARASRGGVRGDSYVQKYVVAFLAAFLIFILLTVALTNYLLSGAISRTILKPLRILKLGAREIAGGNLDFRPDYAKDDEFGDVCREFDRMRDRLKESVAEKLRYENYRRELLRAFPTTCARR